MSIYKTANLVEDDELKVVICLFIYIYIFVIYTSLDKQLSKSIYLTVIIKSFFVSKIKDTVLVVNTENLHCVFQM